MKAIIVMFDSLNKQYLPPYGCDWVHAPNFERLAKRATMFERAYVGSLPCMPARRELHTGRLNFLHRGWSPLEPFDDSMPELLHKAGVHTHLVSDHYHYWEDGGATYHTRYSTWEFIRGQEGDPWKGNLSPDIKATTLVPRDKVFGGPNAARSRQQDAVNRLYMQNVEDSCQRQTFDKGLEFIETNHKYDNWLVQIECFDPHEPFFTYDQYLKLYDKPELDGEYDWPPYDVASDSPEMIQHIKAKYASLITMCDDSLGQVMDMMDKYNMWEDTMLIVTTDHGYLLGEHGWWAKNMMPCYNEIVNVPMFMWDPRSGVQGQKRDALIQLIDVAPTLLKFFGQDIPADMLGKDLAETIASDTPVRDYALFGYHGNQINITDGRYVYMKNPDNLDIQLYDYTLMPTNMASRMGEVLEQATLAKPFSFTKNMPVLKIPAKSFAVDITKKFGTQLFDLAIDPNQQSPIQNETEENRLKDAMVKLMKQNDAPAELYERMGLQWEWPKRGDKHRD